MRILLGLALVTLLALPTAQAAADTTPAPVEVVFIDADRVTGDLARPGGEVISTRRNAGHRSLIRVRSSFVQELLKDTEDL